MGPTDGAAASILEGLPDAVVAIGRDERILFVNARAEELFGYTRDELVGGPVARIWPVRLRERYTRNLRHYFEIEHPMRFSTEAWGLRSDGTEFVGEMSWGIVATSSGPLLLAIGRDVTARRASEDRLRAMSMLGERALAGTDPAHLAADAVSLLCSTLPVSGAAVRFADGGELTRSGPVGEASICLPLGTGDELLVTPQRELDDEELTAVRAVANILATAIERLRDEDRMRHDALHDPLTGLANRTLLGDRLQHALAQSEREHGDTGVLFVDLDDFKQVNDRFGHPVGDEVLATLGNRLRAAVRPADTVARLGGDEFVVVCEHADEAGLRALADRLESAIIEPVHAGGTEHHLSASIGISLGHLDASTLLREADTAVYRAKAAGGACVELFSAS